jgi:hypothetical protein
MPQKVFVSYSHDSDAHKMRVKDFVSRLRGHDIIVTYDADMAHKGGPDEGWARWCERQIVESDYVLACCTAMFHERFDGHQAPHMGLGVAWEAQTIRQYLYNNPGANRKIRPLLLNEADRSYIPNLLQPYHCFLACRAESYSELLAWLQAIPPITILPPSSVNWPLLADDFARQLADRSDEFNRFKEMMSGRIAQRALLIQAPSGSGKTALIHECVAYAQHRNVRYSHVDFKGGLSIDDVLETLMLDLGRDILRQTFSCSGSSRSYAIITDLQDLQEPVLLAFDTFQDATQQGKNWLENQLLPRIGRCPALIVAVAGQTVPEQSARSWSQLACTVSLPPIRRVEDWIDFAGRTYGPTGLTREHVEAWTIPLDGNPAQVSAMLEVLIRKLPPAQLDQVG